MKVQSFTRELSEESTGYAKLQSKKFRKIRYNAEEQAIMKDADNAAIVGVSAYFKENPEDEDAYFSIFDNIRNPRSVDLDDFEVFYSFSNSIRGNRKYGNSNWSARFLYEFLSAGYNGGERFIDTYLNRVFMYRPVYEDLKETVDYIQQSIETKWNDGQLKGGQWAAFYNFQSAQTEHLSKSLRRFSRNIREDIIMCLSNGMIPMNFSLKSSTIEKRRSLGISGDSPFYATSWLINQISVHVILGSSNTGQMYYSDSYKGAR